MKRELGFALLLFLSVTNNMYGLAVPTQIEEINYTERALNIRFNTVGTRPKNIETFSANKRFIDQYSKPQRTTRKRRESFELVVNKGQIYRKDDLNKPLEGIYEFVFDKNGFIYVWPVGEHSVDFFTNYDPVICIGALLVEEGYIKSLNSNSYLYDQNVFAVLNFVDQLLRMRTVFKRTNIGSIDKHQKSIGFIGHLSSNADKIEIVSPRWLSISA